MKSLNLTFLSLIALICSLTGYCDVNKSVEQLKEAKIEIYKVVDQTPYKEAEQIKIKNYFLRLDELISEVKNRKRLVRKFNKSLKQADLNLFCSTSFIEKTFYSKLLSSCTKNRFFICADEVQGYENQIKAFKELLNEEMITQFNETEACRGTI